MTARDIADLRRWHRQGVQRAMRAGYDLVYVYAGHGLSTIQAFLSRRFNKRNDAYGGPLKIGRDCSQETLEDTLEVAEGRVAVACRLCVDELVGADGLERPEIEELLAMLGELPDLWDFMVGDWDFDSLTSRFSEEGSQEPYVRGLKALTSKPVVGVGRFTSADMMVRMIRDGVLDMIGSARPSIADPFLPNKIRDGRWEDIRECIGCNICVAGDWTNTSMRCTQNPTMGEEWRRGWHPERIRPKQTGAKILVVGAGPAGLEAAMSLGQRGYEVVLADAAPRVLGGRVVLEARLPGLAAWIRVVDYRLAQLRRLKNVQVARGSTVTAEEVLRYDFDHVAVATGARWRADGVGRATLDPIPLAEGLEVLTPDDLLRGRLPAGDRVVLFDDDHYYIGGALAELLAAAGKEGNARYTTGAGVRMDGEHHGAAPNTCSARGGWRLDRSISLAHLRELGGDSVRLRVHRRRDGARGRCFSACYRAGALRRTRDRGRGGGAWPSRSINRRRAGSRDDRPRCLGRTPLRRRVR